MVFAEVSVLLGGTATLVIAVFHVCFYKLFGWEKDFGKLGVRNRKIYYSIHVALMLLLFGIAGISFGFYEELAKAEGLAFGMLLMLFGLWLWRTIWQIYYFRPNSLGGKTSGLHVVLIFVFAFNAAFYGLPLLLVLW